MAVRFTPVEGAGHAPQPDRDNLAEVIELRSRLRLDGAGNGLHADEPRPDTDRETAASPTPTSDETRDTAVRILARKARSSGELRSELLQRDHDPHIVEDIIDEFRENLYLDDLGLARVTTENLRDLKRASRGQIRLKLRERKIPDEAIEAALAELDDDDEYALLAAAAQDRARKLQGLDRHVAERRLLGFLARRGWSGEPAYRAVREALDQAGGGDRPHVRFQ